MDKLRKILLLTVSMVMVIYHLVATQYMLVGTYRHLTLHLGFSLLLVYLDGLGKSKRRSGIAAAGLILTLISAGYTFGFSTELEWRGQIPMTSDAIIGIILMLLVVDSTRRIMGWSLPILAIVFVAYLFLGCYLPQPLTVGSYPWDLLLGQLSMIGSSGIYGTVLTVSANGIFLFIVFGGLLKACGATLFFSEVTKPLRAKISGGAALSAVLTSQVIGMATGSPTANVAIAGSFTIPLMIKGGYQPKQAAAIEATASTGGQIMPPVLGAAAFVMAAMIGVSYFTIALGALIPAILYYISAGVYAQLQAKKMGIRPMEPEKIDWKETLLRMPLFLIPLIILTLLLFKGFSPAYTVFWAIVALLILSFARKATRPGLGVWLDDFVDGARSGAQIAVACALLGLVVSPMVMSGLGIKLPQWVEVLSGGNIALLLVLTMVGAIVVGSGIPVVATYVLMGMVLAPVLVKGGFLPLQAHMFVFYFAVLSFLTPPEASAVMVASSIARSPFMATGWEAMKVGLGGILAPFFFMFFPGLLLLPANPLMTVMGISLALVSTLAFQTAICGYLIKPMGSAERALFASCAALLAIGAFARVYSLCGIVTGLLIVMSFIQSARRKAPKRVTEVSMKPRRPES